jgi:hypothetical protein
VLLLLLSALIDILQFDTSDTGSHQFAAGLLVLVLSCALAN